MPVTPTKPNDKRLIRRPGPGSLLEFDDTAGRRQGDAVDRRTATRWCSTRARAQLQVTHQDGSTITFTAAGQVQVTANATVDITASAVNVHAPTAIFDGMIQLHQHDRERRRGLAELHPRRRERLVTAVEAASDPRVAARGPVVELAAARLRRPHGPGESEDRRAVRADPAHDPEVRLPGPGQHLPGRPRRPASRSTPRSTWSGTSPARASASCRRARTTDRLKLYLASHHRHYLVVCSLHCDVAGFPHVPARGRLRGGHGRPAPADRSPGWSRRRAGTRPAPARRRAGQEARGATQARQPGRAAVPTAPVGNPSGTAGLPRCGRGQAAGDIREYWGPQDDVRVLEGWIPTGVDATGTPSPMPACPSGSQLTPVAGIGSWQPVDELPAELTEASYPLSPLVADPTKPDHDAHRGVDLLRRRTHRLLGPRRPRERSLRGPLRLRDPVLRAPPPGGVPPLGRSLHVPTDLVRAHDGLPAGGALRPRGDRQPSRHGADAGPRPAARRLGPAQPRGSGRGPVPVPSRVRARLHRGGHQGDQGGQGLRTPGSRSARSRSR